MSRAKIVMTCHQETLLNFIFYDFSINYLLKQSTGSFLIDRPFHLESDFRVYVPML